ncbi:hypothetical protein [Amycolatopsis sp. FDAARGOS 1241]|uniref:hypothetical protein n=1 Tax=Amycolatopsis sp. FDAARGOS 1241 TaxID=2778070 RepID=UPI001950AFEB|nr:hypothetical protein [Amycolatopsis sp. FDAARGOS 1241]QRP43423.1 hypothetical protein I6J71_28910 [Amycolatopsis sp. FDAARGOS 1241]
MDSSPARNRVTPLGEIVAIPLRGAWTGNRGVLHSGREIVRTHASDLWLTCRLEFRGRWREQWLPRRYTHLFFHDEAVSFAAGHRPCGECRRADYVRYRDTWARVLDVPPPSARAVNRQLHTERLAGRRRRLHPMAWRDLPDGAFVLLDDVPAVVVDGELTEWTTSGYGIHHRLPREGTAQVITPPSTLAVLRGGYAVQIDPSARR